MLAPGVLVERYELVSPLGDGGMASVWAARQHGKHGFEKLVALKVIHSRYAEDPTFRTMFLDEARVVASLVHRNVAQVFDLGDTGELLYLVLEYIDGESLFALTAPQRTVPYAVALRIVADACAGIAAVHALTDQAGVPRNIVHRDVSPQNILLSMSGEVKLIDFGIAKARDRASKTTDINTVKGKLRYMAPEQAQHQPVGPSTDVFALGAVLFRLLAGMPPYAAPNDLATIQALLAHGPALNALPPEVPLEIAAIVKQSIAPQSSDRFLSAKAMKEAIESILASEPRAPDVASWVQQNLSEQGRQRQTLLAARLASTPSMRAAALAPPPPEEKAPSAPPPTQAMEGRPVPGVPDLGAPATGTAPMMAPLPDRERERVPSATHAMPEAPAFMDVRALVAQAKSGGIPQTRPPSQPYSVFPSNKPKPQQPPHGVAPDLPSTPTPSRGNAQPPTPAREIRLDLAVRPLRAAEPPRWGRAPKIVAIVLVVTVAVAAVLVAIPLVVRNRAIAAASAAGFDIKVGSAGVGLSGVRLKDVAVHSARAPGFSATIPQVDASYSLTELRLQSPVVLLEGEPVDLEVGLGVLLEEDRTKYAGTAAAPRHLAILGGKVTWNAQPGAPAKTGRRATVDDLAVDVESRGVGTEDVKGSIGRATLHTTQTTFGPWGASLERTPTALRVRVAFDPPVADGPSALYVAGSAVPTEVTVKIPRYQWAHLGLVPAELGLPVDPTSELELNLAATMPSTANGSLKLDATILRLKVQAFRAPLDVHAVGTASGPPGKPLNIDKMNITAGPFTATTTGTITPRSDGVRLDALFKVTPIGCDKLATYAGGVAAFVQSLGQTTGVFGLNGTLNVSGVVKYDSAEPADGSVTWLAKESCGVSIFGL